MMKDEGWRMERGFVLDPKKGRGYSKSKTFISKCPKLYVYMGKFSIYGLFNHVALETSP